jgi:hypothetical protein
MTFNDYMNAMEGKTAWIFGKGPSLEVVHHIKIPADDVVIAINEACNVVDADFVFCHEAESFPLMWNAPGVFILEYKFTNAFKEEEKHRIVCYNKFQHEVDGKYKDCIKTSKEEMQQKEMLVGITGTAHSAFHFCHYAGITKVILVGFDYEADGALYSGLGQLANYTMPQVYQDIYEKIMEMSEVFKIQVKRIRYV